MSIGRPPQRWHDPPTTSQASSAYGARASRRRPWARTGTVPGVYDLTAIKLFLARDFSVTNRVKPVWLRGPRQWRCCRQLSISPEKVDFRASCSWDALLGRGRRRPCRDQNEPNSKYYGIEASGGIRRQSRRAFILRLQRSPRNCCGRPIVQMHSDQGPREDLAE